MKFTLALRIAILVSILYPAVAEAQFTETFESVTASGTTKPAAFTSNGQTFNLITADCNTGTFGVFIPGQSITHCSGNANNISGSFGVGTNCSIGTCSGTSQKFIDNSGGIPVGITSQVYAIKTANNALFTIKSLFLYLSSDYGTNPSGGGGVTFRGRVNGSVVFTFVKTTGFNTSFGTNNGFTYIDFAPYTTTNIDELEVQGGSTTNYVGIDNFTTGTSIPLPVRLISFDVSKIQDIAQLKWQADNEVNFAGYDLERSLDGIDFTNLGTVQGTNIGVYEYYDYKPEAGNNFYRLRMVDMDGRARYSAIKSLSFPQAVYTNAYLYPNPATDIAWLCLPATQSEAWLAIYDLTGRVCKQLKVSAAIPAVSLADLPPGLYLYHITGADKAFLGAGKIRIK